MRTEGKSGMTRRARGVADGWKKIDGKTPAEKAIKEMAKAKKPSRKKRLAPKRRKARTGRAAGRPSKFKPEFVDIVGQMVKNGATDSDIAEALGVSIRSVWRWQSEHQAFCQALVVPPGAPDDRVERSLFQRAVGYSYDAEKIFQYEGQPVRVPYVEHVPPDANAGMRWLTNRRPDRWRDKVSAEVTGKDGAPLVPEVSDRSMARAILDILREARLDQEPAEEVGDHGQDEVEDLPSAAHADALRTTRKINATTSDAVVRESLKAPAATPAEPASSPQQKRGLAPNESECFDNGAAILMDAERGKYAVFSGDGMLCGYRVDYAVARAFAQSLPVKT